jgi:hypothetical protein
MPVNPNKIIEELSLKSFGAKGWLKNDKISCPSPNCGKSGKFGFKIDEKGGGVHCFICDFSQNIYAYLISINRKDLISNTREYSTKKELNFNLKRSEEEESVLTEVKLPHGCKSILNDIYLNERGFTNNDYKTFHPLHTKSILSRSLHNYIIFQLKQENRLVGWLARSRYSKEWHEQNLKESKQGNCDLQLRYRNSEGTDFTHILGGHDEITDKTETVILVEGLFDRVGVNSKLKLDNQQEIKCCFTFGNKVSDEQINLLRNRKSIKNLILLYDYGTIKQSKTYGIKLSKYFNTDVCLIKNKSVDPGDMPLSYLLEVLKNRKDAINFYITNI